MPRYKLFYKELGGAMVLNYRINTLISKITLASLLVASLYVQSASAARPDSLKDTLSTSQPSVAANHIFVLDMAAGTSIAASETVTITFASSTFGNVDNVVAGDVTWTDSGAHTVVANGACASDNVELTSATTTTLTFTACSGYSGSTGGTVTITIGNDRITNPTAGTYYPTVAGNYGDDSQDTAVAIIAGVSISASINTTISFSIVGVNSGSCPTTGGTTVTTSDTSIPFGTTATEAFYDGCQDLRVSSNTGGGYTTTVQTVAGLDAGSNSFAAGSCDGSCNLTTPNAWTDATLNGYAICMKDQSSYGTGAATANAGWDTSDEQCGGASQKFELVADVSAAQSASTIMTKASATSDDRAFAGWRFSADAAQAAGAYTGTAVYITTPTF